MCNVAVIEFFIENVERKEFENKRVLEVGSKYVNGSARFGDYTGLWLEAGRWVGRVGLFLVAVCF
jgi:hypothetical protein